MILALLLLGHIIRADIFDGVNLEKVLSEGLKGGGSGKSGPDSASLSLSSKKEGMSSASSPASFSSSIPSMSQASSSTVASVKKSGEEMPIVIITQESPKDKGKGKGGKEQEEEIASIVKNAIKGTKSNGLSTEKREEEDGQGESNYEEFKEESDKSKRKDKPSMINNSFSPMMAKAVGNSSDLDSYWTTVIVDNKLKKVKVNVKVMTVVESIGEAAPCSKDGDVKEKSKFWSKPGESSKSREIPSTVSVAYKKDEMKTSQDSKSSSKSNSDEKTKKTAEASRSVEPEIIPSVISSGKGTESKKESETLSASKPLSSSISLSVSASRKSNDSESASSKYRKSAESVKTSTTSTKEKSSSKETESKSTPGISTKEDSKKGNSSTVMSKSQSLAKTFSSIATVSPSVKSKKKSSSSQGSASKESSSTVSIGQKKSKEMTKDAKSISVSKSEKEDKAESGKKEVNPEMNELFYVLKNMPGKVNISKSGGKMFVEGNFVAPKEEKLKDKKFQFSGYIQAAHA
ncbi:uncharacterized protein Eint_071520 [Encephalitozoon intestinalis ATCC 50506]|uniref:Uncharacterized protein n=1 Tax=Encephalitozoon intestinalis (strain ATCC 50506) TaxID=876142 RepID=E0S876_ENCIT|nr:uncharacterized protein Eint_071520 [Encephalitozoon intestinalis ATCC 50506]ADM11911.1 hypothetical protein Eint_071520 [Encephalitozoon intestinalis ATCC 50506]UTX45667.1 hypothetical protein GPK93_07g12360 [Encephalitozoon intestinalis]